MALFVDKARITVKAGNGGNGCVSFHREKFVQNGGPDGGDGGRGGDVVLLADESMHTLMDFRNRRKFVAPAGEDGSSRFRCGKSGEALVIKVPPGTIVRDVQTGRVLADMHVPGERRVLLSGGRGGWGNTHFATPTRQAPNFAKPGEKREMREMELELKSLADVGLVGYPNVGKSTILSVVTSARPIIDTVSTSMPALRAMSTMERHSTSSMPSAMKTLILLILKFSFQPFSPTLYSQARLLKSTRARRLHFCRAWAKMWQGRR